MGVHEIQLSEDHERALRAIKKDWNVYDGMSDLIMTLIEAYLSEEQGRIGRFIGFNFYPAEEE